MKAKKVITTCGIILGGLAMAGGASALSYVDDSQIQFTFNSMLTMSLSSGDLTITDLAPGNSANSAPVTITVNTNSQYGYGLYATVGNTTYNNTNLNGATGATFTSVATSANATSLSGGYWGYSIDAGAHYNGLPLYTATNGAELKTTTGAASNDTTSFLIGAAADTTQTQDTYNNVINFSAVAKMDDYVPTMQEVANEPTMCATDAPLTVTDSRDGQSYTVQRLADGKCWMTSNLNLAGGTALYSDDSNVPTTGYTKASGNAYYTLPASQTITSGTSLPSSAFSDNSTAYVFNTGNKTTSQSDCTSSKPCNSYYSWLAATAGGKNASGSAVTSDGHNTAYSICPKGWRLPTATTEGVSRDNGGYTGGDFYNLAIQYGMATGNYYENPDNAPTFYSQAGPGTTPNFLLAGYYSSGSFGDGGSHGNYWSATSDSGTGGYNLHFDSGYVYSANGGGRSYGFSVRCVLAEQ